MNKQIEEMVKALPVDENVKNSLLATDRVLNSKSEKVRESAFAPLVVTDDGSTFEEYGKAYSAIVDASLAHPIKGASTFLSLVFPKGNEQDERLFFASPRRAASVQNRFYGTMLVSFGEFDGLDLVASDSLQHLLEFVEMNKDNIKFVFHIKDKFSAKGRLMGALQEVVNVKEVGIEKPSAERSYTYIIGELEARGLKADEEAKRCIRERALPNIILSRNYTGYKTLNAFLGRLSLESAITDEGDEFQLDASVVNSVLDRIKTEEEAGRNESHKMGFCS